MLGQSTRVRGYGQVPLVHDSICIINTINLPSCSCALPVKIDILYLRPLRELMLDYRFNILVCCNALQVPLHLLIMDAVVIVSPILLFDVLVAFLDRELPKEPRRG
jgi:hypothetical protein